MINLDPRSKNKIYSILSFLFIISLFFHKFVILKNFSFLKVSEFIFIFLFLIYFIFDLKKIKENLDKIDLLFCSWPILNFIQYILNPNNLLGFLSSIYVFFIYLIFKNLFFDLGKNRIINYLIFSLIFSSILSITGWSLSQLHLDLNLTEFKVGWPIYLFERYRSIGFMPTPNMLFFFLSFGYLLIQDFEIKNKKFILVFIFFGIFFTFSKSLILFIPLIMLPYVYRYSNSHLLKGYLFFFLMLVILFNFLTNFIVAPKNTEFFKDHKHSHYMDKDSDPLFENKFLTIYPSNYAQIKTKSIKIIQDNIFTGIGYNQFKDFNIEEQKFILGYKPHSSIFGLVAENGIFSLIIFSLIIFNILKSNFKKNDYYIFVSIFLILESVNMDIHHFKILWVFFPLLIFNNKIKN